MKAAIRHRGDAGFTLIELMIVVAIIAVLMGIALPQYNDYVLKSKLSEAFSTLSSVQLRMEQYYQDNRTYANGGNCGVSPTTAETAQAKYFTFSCAVKSTTPAGQGFTYTATSASLGFTFTIEEDGTKKTTAAPAGWPATPVSCWVRGKGGC